jgi:hypothetical protein
MEVAMTHDSKCAQRTPSAPTATTPQQQRALTPTEQAAAFLKARAETGSALAALQAVKPQARGRLIFAMDVAASRESIWELARELTAAMFAATAGCGSAGGCHTAHPLRRSIGASRPHSRGEGVGPDSRVHRTGLRLQDPCPGCRRAARSVAASTRPLGGGRAAISSR